MQPIFITGGKAYIGGQLSTGLHAKSYTVKAFIRKGSEAKLPIGVIPIIADAFEAKVFRMKYGGFASVTIHS